jgi:hypothetical protein
MGSLLKNKAFVGGGLRIPMDYTPEETPNKKPEFKALDNISMKKGRRSFGNGDMMTQERADKLDIDPDVRLISQETLENKFKKLVSQEHCKQLS